MFKIEAILADNLRNNDIETRTVLVLQINDRKTLTNINSFLTENLSLNHYFLTHLKRIKSNRDKCEIIIAPVPDFSGSVNISLNDNLFNTIIDKFDNQKVSDFLNQFDVSNFHIRSVPSIAPLTRTQFENASKFWPVNFHENKYLSKCLNSTLFSGDELKIIYDLIQYTLNLTKKNELSIVHRNVELCSLNPCFKTTALVVKDKRTHVVASGLSETDSNPANHAAIVAIENVATLQRMVKDQDDRLSPELYQKYQDDYLCTNYEFFLSQEPCLMCAMAMVHSRVKRVFFFSGDSTRVPCEECNDQAFTVHQLHVLPNLNHHYEVWRISPISTKTHEEQTQTPNCEFPNKRSKLST